MNGIAATKGLMIAAPTSGSGKTLLTLALLRAFANRDIDIRAAKAGPDYIDPGFHAIACGRTSVNLDAWAMAPGRLRDLAHGRGGSLLLVEAMMGLFDGAADGTGSAADLAVALDIPVILVLDCARQSHSVAALAKGFREFRRDVDVAGVILNRVGSARHEKLLRDALSGSGIAVLGGVPRNDALMMPERHLGLVQAGELADSEKFIEFAAGLVAKNVDLEALMAMFAGLAGPKIRSAALPAIPPLGQHIAIARDEAFSFCYPHLVADWRGAGATLSFFSPLHNEAPDSHCDAVYLPGGYPELHAGRLAAADRFQKTMLAKAEAGTVIYGECGGYMVLGEGLADGEGQRHRMLGLLALETSFEKRKLHLGYRKVQAEKFPLGTLLMMHEFHYSSVLREAGEALFRVEDALGETLGNAGLRKGSVMGSYLHVIEVRP